MITLIVLSLIAAGILYLILFGIFKLIWIICKSNRNFWPLVLAGVGTVLFCTVVVCATWWGVKTVMAPFKPMIARAKQHPELVYGPRTYTDDKFPFELTVVDGMDFSQWINFNKVSLKIGADTNAFKQKGTGQQPSQLFLQMIIRAPIENKENPFEQLEQIKDDPNFNPRFKVLREERGTVNGLPAYHIDGVAYSNRGPVNTWTTTVANGDGALYYLVFMNFGEEKTEQIETVRNSFRQPGTAVSAPSTPLSLPEPATEEQPA